jgi:hypothetical protein
VEKEAETVKIKSSGGKKLSFMDVKAVSADGEEQPLPLITKSKTD